MVLAVSLPTTYVPFGLLNFKFKATVKVDEFSKARSNIFVLKYKWIKKDFFVGIINNNIKIFFGRRGILFQMSWFIASEY